MRKQKCFGGSYFTMHFLRLCAYLTQLVLSFKSKELCFILVLSSFGLSVYLLIHFQWFVYLLFVCFLLCFVLPSMQRLFHKH